MGTSKRKGGFVYEACIRHCQWWGQQYSCWQFESGRSQYNQALLHRRIFEERQYFLIATDDDKVDRAISIIHDTCKSRRRMIAPEKIPDSFGAFNMAMPIEVKVGGATVFTLNIEQFFKL